MQLLHILLVGALLSVGTYASFFPDFKPSSPGFHHKLKDATGYRLPGTARPTFYDLALDVAFQDSNIYLTGEVTITLDVEDSNSNGTYSLQLNSGVLFDVVTEETFVWNGNVSCLLEGFGPGFIAIKCPERINGTDQTLRIKYELQLIEEMYGAYWVRYNESGAEKNMLATQFEQDGARRVMPCFDEPEYKAPIRLTLRTDTTTYNLSDWMSNMKVNSTTTNGTEITTVFNPTPSMSTYLLAFVVTQDYKLFTDDSLKATYEFGVFARPTAEGYVSVAVQNGPKLLELMSNFTGIPYETLGNDKMTFAAIPEFAAGAMENWGLITFREQILIDEGPTKTTGRDVQYITEVIAHELTHQWFGDYVTTDWWSETWLNEGFAEYFEYYLTQELLSEFDVMRQMVLKEQQVALKADSKPDTIALSNNASDVTTEDDFSNEFGDISYAKGASIVKMIRYCMGDKAFQSGLRTYLKSNKYSNSTSEILIDTLQKALPDDSQTLDLKTVLHAWVFEGGYPLVSVSLGENNTVSIQATKFLSSLNKTEQNNTSNWWLPLTYTTSQNPDFTTIDFDWIDPAKVSEFNASLPATDANDSWIVFNLQSAGFYRVIYDETLWNRLINALNSSKSSSTIDVLSRSQLLDDAFNIAKWYDGEESELRHYYLRAFNLAEYLQFETEYFPWYTYFIEIQYLLESIQDVNTLSILKQKILETISPQVIIPPTTTEEASHTETLRRNLLATWACKLGHQECVQWAKKQFNNYKTDISSIDNNYRDVIVCTGLANSDDPQADFDKVFALLQQSTLPFEEKDLAKALTCVGDEALMEQALGSTIDYANPPFSRMFYDTILSGFISDGAEKLRVALNFLLVRDYSINQYWQAIETPEAVLKKIATKIYSQDNIELIQLYIQQNNKSHDHQAMIEAAKVAILTATENIAWLNKYGEVLTSVIVYNGGDITTPSTPTDAPPSKAEKLGYNVLLITLIVVSIVKVFIW